MKIFGKNCLQVFLFLCLNTKYNQEAKIPHGKLNPDLKWHSLLILLLHYPEYGTSYSLQNWPTSKEAAVSNIVPQLISKSENDIFSYHIYFPYLMD